MDLIAGLDENLAKLNKMNTLDILYIALGSAAVGILVGFLIPLRAVKQSKQELTKSVATLEAKIRVFEAAQAGGVTNGVHLRTYTMDEVRKAYNSSGK